MSSLTIESLVVCLCHQLITKLNKHMIKILNTFIIDVSFGGEQVPQWLFHLQQSPKSENVCAYPPWSFSDCAFIPYT